MVNPRYVLLMGLPCSGKTTYALSDYFIGFEYINPVKFDDIAALQSHILSLIDQRKDIVIDDDNLTIKDRSEYLGILNAYNKFGRPAPRYVVECHHIISTLSEIVNNGHQRESSGGQRLNKAKLLHSRSLVEVPTTEEGFQIVIRVPLSKTPENKSVHKAVFFSLPSVVFSIKGHISPTKPSDVRVYLDVNRMFSEYSQQGYLFIGIANLPMIESQQISEDTAQDCIIETIKQLTPPIEAVYYSPHSFALSSDISLPNPAFAYRAKEKFKINLGASVMVGATSIDQQFAKNAGIGKFLHRDDFFKKDTDFQEEYIACDWY